MFAPISTIFGILLSSATLPNGIRLLELPSKTDSVEIIAGYEQPGLTLLASTSAARTLIFNAFAAGGSIQMVSEQDRTALRLTIPQWALPTFMGEQLSAFFKDPPRETEKARFAARSWERIRIRRNTELLMHFSRSLRQYRKRCATPLVQFRNEVR